MLRLPTCWQERTEETTPHPLYPQTSVLWVSPSLPWQPGHLPGALEQEGRDGTQGVGTSLRDSGLQHQTQSMTEHQKQRGTPKSLRTQTKSEPENQCGRVY